MIYQGGDTRASPCSAGPDLSAARCWAQPPGMARAAHTHRESRRGTGEGAAALLSIGLQQRVTLQKSPAKPRAETTRGEAGSEQDTEGTRPLISPPSSCGRQAAPEPAPASAHHQKDVLVWVIANGDKNLSLFNSPGVYMVMADYK